MQFKFIQNIRLYKQFVNISLIIIAKIAAIPIPFTPFFRHFIQQIQPLAREHFYTLKIF